MAWNMWKMRFGCQQVFGQFQKWCCKACNAERHLRLTTARYVSQDSYRGYPVDCLKFRSQSKLGVTLMHNLRSKSSFTGLEIDDGSNASTPVGSWHHHYNHTKERENRKRSNFQAKRNNGNDNVGKYDYIEGLLISCLEQIKVKSSPGSGLTFADWDEIERILTAEPILSRHWPTRLMKSIVKRKSTEPEFFDAAKSLLQFVKEKEHQESGVTVALLASFLEICGLQGFGKHQDLISDVYADIKKMTDVLDPTSAEMVIKGLAQTERWLECLPLLEMVELISNPTTKHYSPILCAAANTQSLPMFWAILDILGRDGLVPEETVLDAVLTNFPNEHNLVFKVLNVYGKYGWIPSVSTAKAIGAWFESDKDAAWITASTTNNRRGICQSCGNPLKPYELLAEEFDQLRDQFLEKSLKKSDVFLNSSPEEFQHFQDFLIHNGPFDVVLDSLNLYHVVRPAQQAMKAEYVCHVVEYFVEKLGKKVLVLGRNHIKKSWSPRYVKRMTQLAHWFLTDNSSADDPYMLYAALHSGPDTMIVTKDHLRDHSFLLGTRMGDVFRQWQRTHQVVFLGMRRGKHGKEHVKFKWPDHHETKIQQSSVGWHIPYDDGSERPSYELPNTWICIKR